MTVSVIIPVYNAQAYIEASVNSILNQTYTDLEILICDDASQDNSREILSNLRDPRIRLVHNRTNLGYLKTINKLFGHCTTPLIAFQDADDISHPQRIEFQVEHLINQSLDLLGTNYALIDESGKEVLRKEMEVNSEKLERQLIQTNLFQKPSILFKREILSTIGGYREGFLELKNISEDYDWLLRINEGGYKMGNINGQEPLYHYRSVSTAMTKGFNHVEQLFGHRVAQHLAIQRRSYGTDDLHEGNLEKIRIQLEEWKKPYLKDPSLFYLEKAGNLMYAGLKKQAVFHAWKAVVTRPSFKNLRSLQYCLRKLFFSI